MEEEPFNQDAVLRRLEVHRNLEILQEARKHYVDAYRLSIEQLPRILTGSARFLTVPPQKVVAGLRQLDIPVERVDLYW